MGNFIFRNGEEWLTLRAALRPLMLRIKEVANFLPQTEKAATKLVQRLDADRRTTPDGSIPKLPEVVGKWLQECKNIDSLHQKRR